MDDTEERGGSIGSFIQSLMDDAKNIGKKSLRIILITLGIFSICWLIFTIFVYVLITGLGPEWYFKALAIIVVIGLIFLPLYLFFEYSGEIVRFSSGKKDIEPDPTVAPARINPLAKFLSFFTVIGSELKRLTVFIGENRFLKGSLIMVILLFLFFNTTPYFAQKWGGVHVNVDSVGIKKTLDTNGLWPGKYEFYNPFKGDGKMTEKERAEYNLRVAQENRKTSNWYNFWHGVPKDEKYSKKNDQSAPAPKKGADAPAYFQYEKPASTVRKMTDAERSAWTDDGVDYSNRYSDVPDGNYQYVSE